MENEDYQMNEPVIKTERLTKTYGSGNTRVDALKEVSVSIDKGEYIAIIGPSGSGKSTFMNLLGCLDKPTNGIIRIENTDVSRLSEKKLVLFFKNIICYQR
jgi:putative ABC transport system ATP-binding protein